MQPSGHAWAQVLQPGAALFEPEEVGSGAGGQGALLLWEVNGRRSFEEVFERQAHALRNPLAVRHGSSRKPAELGR